MHRCVGIVAVGVVSHITRRLITSVRGYCGIAESIAVGIAIPNRSNVTFVDLTIAVIIDAIASFSRSWMHRRVGVIAVRAVSYITSRL
jgi:hypothetical protein